MARLAAFLRGINVGGHNATKDQLCACFEKAGHVDVVTFRASGNVVFEASGRRSAKMSAQIEKCLEAGLGYAVPTFLRTATEIEAIAHANPFPAKQLAASNGKLQVAMLPKRPSAAATKKALAMATANDRLEIDGPELYWLPSGNMSDSELDLKTLEKLLGPWTMRTKGTIEAISEKFVG